MIVEYDGSSYHGWQRQPNALTIQQVLEETIGRVTGEDVRIIASGRTDAGVHSLGQVASFVTRSRLTAEEFSRALNSLMPRDIRILSSSEVAWDFHPQFCARGKTYLYIILNRPCPSAVLTNRCWHIARKLDIEEMGYAANMLEGRHDFSSFRSSSCNAKNPVRTLYRLDMQIKGNLLEFWFEGDGFLKNMVRNIMGTLVDIGIGKYDHERIAEILEARDRKLAGRCAPPWGLYLVSVRY